MNPPTTLLDYSFLQAVADSGDVHHDDAVAAYRQLVDGYVAQRCLLVARADHLAALDQPELFAPIDKVHIAGQHRSAAAQMVDGTLDMDLALTLVMIHRHRIHTVATFDDRLDRYDIECVPDGAGRDPAVAQLSN